MSARSRMTQRALIERVEPQLDEDDQPVTDDYGLSPAEQHATHIEELPCWLYEGREREVVRDEGTAVMAELKLMVPLSAEITEQDRINAISDRLGNIVEPGVLGVETILRKRTHKELTLSRVTG